MELSVGKEFVPIEVLPSDMSLRECIRKKITTFGRGEDTEDPFYVVDLGRLIDLYKDWVSALPSVRPFYAVKCNEDIALLKTLAALGTGFDCASKNEIKTILDLGVSPDRIIYANPCKQSSHLKYAAKKGISLMTFDNELELYKVHKHFPTARLVLRIRADDPDAICQLGVKFGCSVSGGKELLGTAMKLGLNVVGVSFHVGSGSQSPSAYEMALVMSAQLFKYGQSIGYNFTLLDIGGGYPGDKGTNEIFQRVSNAINRCLDLYFNSETYPGLNVIAEPGRYFACSTHSIAVNVIGKRSCDDDGESPSFMYYVNDGVYGSFNCILFDHTTPKPLTLEEHDPSVPVYPTSLWGPTCDGLDKIGDTLMAELSVGDWIHFENMGAYTVAAASSFNGFLKPKTHYYVTRDNLEHFKELHFPSSITDTCLAVSCSPCSSPTHSVGSSSTDEEDILSRSSLSLEESHQPELVVEVY